MKGAKPESWQGAVEVLMNTVCLLTFSCTPGTGLGAKDTGENKVGKNLCFMEFTAQ